MQARAQIVYRAPVKDENAVREAFKGRIRAEARELKKYLRSHQGVALLAHLKARQGHVIIAEGGSQGGYCKVCFLDGEGLKSSIEASGMWVAYCKDPKRLKPHIQSISAEEVVMEFHAKSDKGVRSDTVVKFLQTLG